MAAMWGPAARTSLGRSCSSRLLRATARPPCRTQEQDHVQRFSAVFEAALRTQQQFALAGTITADHLRFCCLWLLLRASREQWTLFTVRQAEVTFDRTINTTVLIDVKEAALCCLLILTVCRLRQQQ